MKKKTISKRPWVVKADGEMLAAPVVGDRATIAMLCARQHDVELVGIVVTEAAAGEFASFDDGATAFSSA